MRTPASFADDDDEASLTITRSVFAFCCSFFILSLVLNLLAFNFLPARVLPLRKAWNEDEEKRMKQQNKMS
jgi:hypothetical protein